MKKSVIILSFSLFIAVSAFLLTACSSPMNGNKNPGSGASKGSLTISFGNHINARSLQPTIDMNPASYSVTGTGPGGASFTDTSTGAAVTENSLAFGTWTIVVNATNAAGNLIGSGTSTAQVNTGSTTTVSITVIPIVGTGTLSLGVTWPTAQVQTPSIVASLTPGLGAAQNLPFTISGGTASYSNTSVGNGYYTLAFTLQDTGIVVAGAVDVVRIVTGQTTSGTYAFSNVNAPGGTIQVNVNANLQNPLAVAITGAQATQAAGTTQALTASVSNYSGNVVYVWYVNGVSATTGSAFTFGTGAPVGYYRIDVTAFTADGTQAGSTTTNVQVTAPLVWTSNNGFAGPYGVVLDSQNRIYVADTNGNRIVRMDDITGKNLVALGTMGNSVDQFRGPFSIALDSLGRIYVSDNGNYRIVRIDDMTGTNWVTYGTQGSGSGQFSNPHGVALDSSGRIYVADYVNDRIVRFDDMSGTNWISYGTYGSGIGNFVTPYSIALDSSNRIYICDFGNSRIVRIDDMSGTNWTSFGSLGNGTGQFHFPAGIAISAAGKIFVSDYQNYRIERFDDMTGANWSTLGSQGTGEGHFSNNIGIAVGTNGYVYVADLANGGIIQLVMP